MTDRYRTVCACGRPECPYRTPAPNTHRKEPIMKRDPLDLVWYALLVLVFVACIVNAVVDETWTRWAFWSLFAVYGGFLLARYFPRRKPCANHWRAADDRRPERPCDCPRCSNASA